VDRAVPGAINADKIAMGHRDPPGSKVSGRATSQR